METIRIVMNGGAPIDVPIADPAHVTAAELNAAMEAAGVDLARVSAVTPGHELVSRLRRLEILDAAERTEAQEWRAWLDDLRARGYGGVYCKSLCGRRHAVPWNSLKDELPWPSLADELNEGWDDDGWDDD